MTKFESDKNIASFFKTVQGEGREGGQLVHFIRMYSKKCFPNRPRCSFCDTVNRKMYKESMSVDDLLKEIRGMDKKPEHYVITGGEPFSFEPIDISNFCNYLQSININAGVKVPRIDFETNGSFFNKENFEDDPYIAACLHSTIIGSNRINISPKLSNSYAKGKELAMEDVYNFSILRNLHEDYNHIDFKFVVAIEDEEQRERDMNDVIHFAHLAKIPAEKIWIMPMTPYNNKEMLQKVADWAIENDFNFSNRLHVQIWGSDIEVEK